MIARLFVSQPFFEMTFKTIVGEWDNPVSQLGAAFNGEYILSKSGPSTVDLTVSSGFWPSAASSVFFVDEFP